MKHEIILNLILLFKAGNFLDSIKDQVFIYQDTTTSYIPFHSYHLTSMWLIVSQNGLEPKSARAIQTYFFPALPLPVPSPPPSPSTSGVHSSTLSKTTHTHTHTHTHRALLRASRSLLSYSSDIMCERTPESGYSTIHTYV